MPKGMGYGADANMMNKNNATSMSKKKMSKTGAQGKQLSMGVKPMMITDMPMNSHQIGTFANMS